MLRGEENQDREIFVDVDKAMLDLFGDEHDRSGLHRPSFPGHDDSAPTSDHVVDLILGVRRLGVGRSSHENKQAELIVPSLMN